MIFIGWSLTALTKCEFNSNYVRTASKTFKYSRKALALESLKYKDFHLQGLQQIKPISLSSQLIYSEMDAKNNIIFFTFSLLIML